MKVGALLGHYHVVRTLGRGGMGAVYEANDTRLNRQVALKVLPPRMAGDPGWLKRFEREAQAVAALNHPNIVTIHSVEEADDVHFIILELVGGKTLDELIPEGGLPLDQLFDIAIPLADAITAAHRRGIAHRDLKPANVMVDEEGRVKVLDFGIAKLAEDVSEGEAATQIGSEALTEEGKIVGTVAYMSPEQAEGKAADTRSDIFSLGIMLYEMATGERPFAGDTKLSILASIVKDNPPSIIERNLEMPRHLARIVKKALEKDLNRRYQSMVELRNDLVELKEEVDAGEPLITGGTLTDPGAMDAYKRPPQKASWGKWVGVGGVAVAIVALAWATFGPGRTAPGAGPLPPVSVTQLTTTSGIDYGGNISQDGGWFAFARQNGDGDEIFLQAVGTRNAIPIATSGTSPAFSDDGERIAFSSPRMLTANIAMGGGIWVMGRTGDDARQLTDFGYNPAWSPDGRRIVFATEFVSSRPYSRAGGSDLHILDVETLVVTNLGLADAVQPSWSPSGHRIAYWAIESGQRDIWTVAADGGTPRAVTLDEYVDYSPAWAPDGRWLYYASTRGGSMGIWRVAIDERSGEVLGDPQQIPTSGVGDPGMLSFSGDGTRLLYTATLTRGSIVAADFDPEALTVGAETTPVVVGTRRLAQPQVSPDGARIVYRTEGAQQDIFVARTDGSREQQVTDDMAKDWAPRWSPDGEHIAFYSNVSGDYETWVMSVDRPGRLRLTDTPGDAPQTPVWSPDGKRIVTFMSQGNRAFVIDADKPFDQQPAIVELPPVPGGNGYLQATDWSADGSRILGAVDPADDNAARPTIWIYEVDAEQYTMLTEGTVATWMADQRRVLVQSLEPAGFFVIDIVSGERTPVEAPPGAEAMVLSRDNSRAYFVQVDQESDIWMIEIGGH